MKSHKTLVVVLAVLALAACGGPSAGPGSSERSTAATSAGDLTLSMAPAVLPLVQGTFNAYGITVTNTTPAPISQITLSAFFPSTTIGGLPANCVRIGGGLPEFFCTFPSIAPGETLAVNLKIRPDVAGTLTYQGAVSGNGTFTNQVQDVEDVLPAPTDVQVTGSSNNGSPPLGSLFTYTFQVKNNGPFATFGGVSFTDPLPASLTFVSLTTNLGTCAGGATVSCALGDLAVGAQATIQITVRAPLTAQTIVNTASAAIGAQSDSNPANNSVSVTVTTK